MNYDNVSEFTYNLNTICLDPETLIDCEMFTNLEDFPFPRGGTIIYRVNSFWSYEAKEDEIIKSQILPNDDWKTILTKIDEFVESTGDKCNIFLDEIEVCDRTLTLIMRS